MKCKNKSDPFLENKSVPFLVALLFAGLLHAQPHDGEALFNQHCAFCHGLTEAPQIADAARAPTLSSLSTLSPQAVIRSLTDGGAMRAQGYQLSGDQRRSIAEYVTGRPVSDLDLSYSSAGRCDTSPPLADPFNGPSWNGWGPDIRNSHFQPAEHAGLAVEDIPGLTLKWAFGFLDSSNAWSQPTVVQGRVYIGSQSGTVFSLDADSGCIHWIFQAESGVRTSLTVVDAPNGSGASYMAVFGDMTGNAYAINADTGEMIWRRLIETHPLARITGSPVVHENRLYIPMSSFEESQGGLEEYPCCTFRGSVSAVDLATGDEIWRTWLVDEPQQTGIKPNDVPLYGPSGAAVWSAPTIDVERRKVYVATGNAYSEPAYDTANAVVAVDMDTGAIAWVTQTVPNDIYVTACARGMNCPQDQEVGPDFDFGTSPILASTPSGRELILVGQKSGVAYAMDPDNSGAIVWEYRAGDGGVLGGIQWGIAYDGNKAYIPVSDLYQDNPGGLHAVDLDTGERIWYAPPPPLACGERERGCTESLSAAITVIPGAVFVGSIDGGFRAYASDTGDLLWEYNTNRDFDTVNGVPAFGGSLIGPGPTVVDGQVFVNSGYGSMGGRDGNVLLVFSVENSGRE